MIARKMSKSDLKKLMRRLSRGHTLIGPVKKLGQYVFAELEGDELPALEYPRTILPIKKYLFPDRETMFELGKGKFKETLPDERFAFLGLHICEINAIRRLDRAMQDDPYYEARRARSFLVGVSCKPDEHCFCKSMKADKLPPGACDLFLSDAGDDYIVHAGTEKGRKMLNSSMFHRLDHPAAAVAAEYQETKHIDIDKVWSNFIKNHDSPLWDEMAKLCLGCANCTVTCPLCYCYDVADRTDVVPDNPRRERFWDSCTLLNFATVVPGHKFRPNIKDRFRNIYTHKFKSFIDGFDLPACVGCGRCTAYCPAGINMLLNLERLEVG